MTEKEMRRVAGVDPDSEWAHCANCKKDSRIKEYTFQTWVCWRCGWSFMGDEQGNRVNE